MNVELRAKEYFDDRATREMAEHLKGEKRNDKETLSYACRILAMTGQEAGLAGQISFRSERPEPSAGCTNGAAHSLALVRAKIVHDHDVAGPQGRNQNLLDVEKVRSRH